MTPPGQGLDGLPRTESMPGGAGPEGEQASLTLILQPDVG